MLSGLCWRSQRRDNEAVFLPFAFPDGAAQPGLTPLASAGSGAGRRQWGGRCSASCRQRGLRAPMERSGNSSGCGHPQLNPNTLAKWKSSALTCKPAPVYGMQEAPGMEGVSARAVSSSSSRGVGFARGALGGQVPASASPHPLTRVTGRLWHHAVMHEAQAYFKHRWDGEQSDPLQ